MIREVSWKSLAKVHFLYVFSMKKWNWPYSGECTIPSTIASYDDIDLKSFSVNIGKNGWLSNCIKLRLFLVSTLCSFQCRSNTTF